MVAMISREVTVTDLFPVRWNEFAPPPCQRLRGRTGRSWDSLTKQTENDKKFDKNANLVAVSNAEK